MSGYTVGQTVICVKANWTQEPDAGEVWPSLNETYVVETVTEISPYGQCFTLRGTKTNKLRRWSHTSFRPAKFVTDFTDILNPSTRWIVDPDYVEA